MKKLSILFILLSPVSFASSSESNSPAKTTKSRDRTSPSQIKPEVQKFYDCAEIAKKLELNPKRSYSPGEVVCMLLDIQLANTRGGL